MDKLLADLITTGILGQPNGANLTYDQAREIGVRVATIYEKAEAVDTSTPPDDRHVLLFPPHPGAVYEASALCSCGEWQFDSGSPGALFNETRLIRQLWTEHAFASDTCEHRWLICESCREEFGTPRKVPDVRNT